MGMPPSDTLWSAPSKKEAEEAICDLQMISQSVGDEAKASPLPNEKVNRKASSSLDLIQPGQQFYGLSQLLSQSPRILLDGLYLLCINPTVKKMVFSLSTDKAVWNAIMKNEMVQEFQRTYHPAKYLKYVEFPPRGSHTQCSDASSNIFAQVINVLCGIAKAVVMKFIGEIVSLVNKLFDQGMNEIPMEIASDLVKYAFMLSVLVFIVVILKRSMNSFA